MKIIRQYQLNGEKLPKNLLKKAFIRDANILKNELEKSNKPNTMLECHKRNSIKHRIHLKLTMSINL